MYAVVGCRECHALWIVEGRPGTTECRRCGKRHQYDRLKEFATADDRETAKQARARLLANRSGHEDAFEAIPGEAVEDAVVSDEELLESKGIDLEAVAETVDRERDRTSRRETVLEALRKLDDPSEADVVEYATARGVPEEYVRNALAKLVETGEASRNGDRYRLL